uniref:Metalloendopeptidase n=1 Tax=Setaria digitata TaxID=48799 RepID=A0A915PX66_9BILA
MNNKAQRLLIAALIVTNKMIHVDMQPLTGAWNNYYVAGSKSKPVVEKKSAACHSVTVQNVSPYSWPTLPYTTYQQQQNSYLEKPLVKRFIAELTEHTTLYGVSEESYGNVLLLMRQYFTRMDPKHRTYDGTLIFPSVNPLMRNELRPNVRITGLLFENDIAPTVSQMKVINSLKQYRGKRKIISDSSYYWKSQTIAYRFGDNDREWQDHIRGALSYWERETCLRFEENKQDSDYLFFIIGSGCYSSVGRLGGSQTISIGYGCETLGIISHELGHALGFWHEQERPDRDEYVTINLQNALSGTEGNFEKRSSSQLIDLGVPYDLGSTFAKRFMDFTVDPTDKKYRSTIGNRVSPSFTDLKQINFLYCSRRCRMTNKRCYHGGYPDPNNCNVCKCPEGLGGRDCTDLQYSSCGYERIASNEWQILEYAGSSNCYWRISSPNGRVRFELTEAHYKCDPTCEEYVEVKHKLDLQVSGFRSCCLPVRAQPTTPQQLRPITQPTASQMGSRPYQCPLKRVTLKILNEQLNVPMIIFLLLSTAEAYFPKPPQIQPWPRSHYHHRILPVSATTAFRPLTSEPCRPQYHLLATRCSWLRPPAPFPRLSIVPNPVTPPSCPVFCPPAPPCPPLVPCPLCATPPPPSSAPPAASPPQYYDDVELISSTPVSLISYPGTETYQANYEDQATYHNDRISSVQGNTTTYHHDLSATLSGATPEPVGLPSSGQQLIESGQQLLQMGSAGGDRVTPEAAQRYGTKLLIRSNCPPNGSNNCVISDFHPPSENDCCTNCSSPCRFRHIRTSPLRSDQLGEVDPICNNELLRQIIAKQANDNIDKAKVRVEQTARWLLGGLFGVICGNDNFAYIIQTKDFCQHRNGNITCYAFRPLLEYRKTNSGY